MSGNRRRGRFHVGGGVWRGRGRGSPDANNSSSRPHSDGAQGRRGGRGVHDPRGRQPERGRGRGTPSSAAIVMPETHDQQANIDARIADDSDKAFIASSRFGTTGGEHPRPKIGTNGTHIALRTNFFPVHVPLEPLYEYDVSIAPLRTRLIRRRVLYLAEQTATWRQAGMSGNVAHDGHARLVSAIQLPQPLTIAVVYYEEGRTAPPEQGGPVYTLSINFVLSVDMANLAGYLTGQLPHHNNYDALPLIALLNTILTSIPRRVDIRAGRNRYFSPGAVEPTGLWGSLEVWRGFQPVLTPVYKQLMVRVGISRSTFFAPGNLARVMTDFRHLLPGANIGVFFRGVRIKTTHFGDKRTIREVVSRTARDHSIITPEYGPVTLEDYFRQKHNIRLRYPDLPLVDLVGRQAPSYLPAEICDVLPGQLFRHPLGNGHSPLITAMARRPPSVNEAAIVNQVRNQLGPDVCRPELRRFGMTIGSDMSVIPGRVLQKPSIQYSSGPALIDDQARWNLRGVKFAIGARLDNWAVLVIKDGSGDEFVSSEDEDLRWAVARFRNACNLYGMHVADNPKYVITELPPKDPSDPLRRAATETIRNALLNVNPKPSLFLVMLANNDQAIYEGLKHLCDVSLDVATVCIQSHKIREGNPHYLANAVSKVNMKLGGINHKLDPYSNMWSTKAITMIVGVHVTHPSPGNAVGTPSIAAVVASVDNSFAQYPATLQIQGARIEVLWLFEWFYRCPQQIYPYEMIENLGSMITDRLILFQKKNDGKLPEQIIVYRSGISESLFNAVRSNELPSILKALRTFRPGVYRPRLTIIVCNRRHQVRFYPTDNASAGRSGNPLPGTVVDRGVTIMDNFDFFLQSHGVSSGTARPIHHYVIYDENHFNADTIQGLTNSLSYTFSRTTEAVRLPSPVLFAKAACRRGRCYLRELFHGRDETMVNIGTGPQNTIQEAMRLWGGGVSGPGLKDTMFYL